MTTVILGYTALAASLVCLLVHQWASTRAAARWSFTLGMIFTCTAIVIIGIDQLNVLLAQQERT